MCSGDTVVTSARGGGSPITPGIPCTAAITSDVAVARSIGSRRSKSYGRAPTFLALTGFEQVRSVVAAIAGDREAAERVELALPDTGVCGGSGLFDAPDEQASSAGSCCAPAPQLIQLGMAPAGR